MDVEKITPELYTKIMQSHPEISFSIEQSPLWQEFQDHIPGRRSLGTYLLKKNEQQIALVSLLELTMRGYSYVWINQGPVWLTTETATFTNDVVKTLRQLLLQRQRNPLFIRAHFSHQPQKGLPAYSKSLIERTTIVDLTQDFDQILAKMNYGARRGMRKASKAGVIIRELPAKNVAMQFAPYYDILAETASRDGFFIHPASTYKSMLIDLDDTVRFFMAFRGSTPIAWAIITVFAGHAIYYYGASNGEARSSMAPYLLHIEAMRTLKDEGVKSYDFLGIGSPSFPGLQGVTQFKLRFGGNIVNYTPVFDIPLRPYYHPWKWLQALKYKVRH